MPYHIIHTAQGYRLKNKETGKMLPGASKSRQMAEARERLIRAKEHGWKPRNRA